MTTPAPDWADEEHQFKLVSILSDITGITDAQIIAVQEWALTAVSRAYVNGRHDGERSGIIKGLREADGFCTFDAEYQDGVSLHAENMTAARIANAIRARIEEMEKGKP